MKYASHLFSEGEVITLSVPSAGNCGDTTLLTCRVTEIQPYSHRLWRKGQVTIMINGQGYTGSGKYTETILIDGFQLEIHNTSLVDADDYICGIGFDRSESQTLNFECKFSVFLLTLRILYISENLPLKRHLCLYKR